MSAASYRAWRRCVAFMPALRPVPVPPGLVPPALVPLALVPSGTTMVPMPESVKISSSTECGRRPSSTCAWGTPPRTARRQASIFGIMPALRPGSRSSSSAALSRLITSAAECCPAPRQFAYRPSTSVSTTSLAASSATASAAAAVSALTL